MENELVEKEENTKFDPKNMGFDLAGKFDLLFKIKIVAAIVTGIAIIGIIINNLNPFTSDSKIELILGIMALALDLAFSVILIRLAKYHDDFNLAGVLYIFTAIVSFLKIISKDASTVFSLVDTVLSLIYMLKFTSIMMELFTPVDLGLKNSWESFRKANIYLTAITFGCAIVVFAPILMGLAALVLIFCTIAAIVISIWEFVLFYKSAKSMRAFASKSDSIPFPAPVHKDWEDEFRSTQNDNDNKTE